MNTTQSTDRRPDYINQFENSTPDIQAMIPAGVTHPVGCLICSKIEEYNERTAVVIFRRKRDGYVCGAACAMELVDRNTPNNKFTFITADQEIKVAGRLVVE